MDDAVFARFQRWAERTLGGKIVRAERQGARRSGGRPAWFLDIVRDGETLACYARMDRGAEQLISREFTLEREYRVLCALGEAGARVPRVYGFCADPAGILMERVAGEFDYTKLAPKRIEGERRIQYAGAASNAADRLDLRVDSRQGDTLSLRNSENSTIDSTYKRVTEAQAKEFINSK